MQLRRLFGWLWKHGSDKLPTTNKPICSDSAAWLLLTAFLHALLMTSKFKGGYAMELRMREARTTKDIDLTLREPMHLLNLTDISNPSGKGMFRTRTNQDLQRR